MHLFARVTAVAAALATATLGLTGAGLLPTQTGDVVTLAAGPVEPTLSPGDDLEIALSVANEGPSLEGTAAEVSITQGTVDTRFALSAWLDGENVFATRSLGSIELATVGSGSTYSATVTVDADSIGFGEQTPAGAYGLRVTIGDAEASTLITVGDSYASAPTTLSLGAIIRSPEAPEGLLDSEQLTASTSDVGSLARQLRNVADHDISVGIDPMIETSVAALPGTVPASARDWVDSANALPHAFHTPYAMSDLLAQLAAGVEPLEPLGYPDPDSDSGIGTVPPTALTEPALIDATGRALDSELLAAASGYGVPVVTTDQLDGFLETPTPSAHVTIDGVSALAADAEVQHLLATASRGFSLAERQAATSSLLGLLTTITREAPNSPRALAGMIDPSGPGAADLLDALEASSWIQLAPMATATDAEPRQATLLAAEPSEFEASVIEAVTTVRDNDARVAGYAEITEDPLLLHAPLRLAALAALHVDDQSDGVDLTRQITAFSTQMSEVLDAVRVLPGSPIQIVGSSVQVPVELVNELETDAEAVVTLRTLSPIVLVDRAETEVTIAAGSSQRVLIPVEVIGSGTTHAVVTLQTPDGAVIGVPVTLEITAQPMIETVLLWAGIAAVVLLLGFGLWRSLRKRRAGEAVGDLDEAQLRRRSTRGPQA